MKRIIPPLLSLRAFEAAARHLSFSKAGDELNVTQGAISRQIKILEGYLHTSLFNRLTRNVELTPFGHSYLASVTSALDTLEAATSNLVNRTHSLTISILPSMGSLWLMQRLTDFTRAYPEIRLHVSSSLEPVDFRREHADLAIRVGKLPWQDYPSTHSDIGFQMVDSWAGVIATHLWDDFLTPVCSRALLEREGPINSPSDLDRFCLIHNDARSDAWPAWLAANGAARVKGTSSLVVGHSFLGVNAARDGLGFACVPTIEIDKVEWRDELVRPFTSEVKSAGAYYLLYPKDRANFPEVKLFKEWLATL